MQNERTTYEDLRSWFLGNYFDQCRDLGTRLKWTRRKIISNIHGDFLSSFEDPVETLFTHVIALVLTSGWDQEEENYYRAQLQHSLDLLGVQDLSRKLSEDESDELIRDLEVLGFIERKDSTDQVS